MPDITATKSDHDTAFTNEDLAVRDTMATVLTDFLKKLDAWEQVCLKYKFDKKGKNYGQAADALTVIANVRVLLNEMTVSILEGK